jgi:hypothetical protein
MASYDMALVDEVRQRLDATYQEALAGLEEGTGHLLLALAAIERRRRDEQAAAQGGELIGKAVALAKEGKVQGMRVRLGDRVLRDLPLPEGVAGAVFGAVLSNLLSQLAIDLLRREPEEPRVPAAEELE